MKGGSQTSPFGGCLVYAVRGLACQEPATSMVMAHTEILGAVWVPACNGHRRDAATSRPEAPFIDLVVAKGGAA